MTSFLTAPIRFYQKFISPGLPPRCKYYPSCSKYTLDAVNSFGIRGVLLGLWRLLRCNPFSHGGVDYIPGAFLGREAVVSESLKKRQKTHINQANLEVAR
jgi:putative membrane protein insertion efficiency factor